MPTAYKINSRKITLREYRNLGTTGQALLAWALTRIGVPLPSMSGFLQPDNIADLEVAESFLTDADRAVCQPQIQQALGLGFHSPRYYHFENLRKDTRVVTVSMLHRSGEMSLRLMRSVAFNVVPPLETILTVILSELQDGTYFFTTNQGPKFKSDPRIISSRLIGASLQELLDSHQRDLVTRHRNRPAKTMNGLEAMDQIWNTYEHQSTQFNVQRGLYVPLTPQELEQDLQVPQKRAALVEAGQGDQHAAILAELKTLENKQGGWGNAIIILVVTMVLFVGAGAQRWSADYLLMLIPILLFHELGHYVAMRMFNYRNLRMFFIPFFGAAVSGRHYNVPGWKKVIVSLMGPAPGILVGLALAVAGLSLDQPLLVQLALVALILNGFNLLPILPLDGGWILHSLLFCRHPALDATFRLLAVLGLMALGIFGGDSILIFVSIFMLFSVPHAYRLARITQTLRARGVARGSPDDQNIPTETAVAIIDELKGKMPSVTTNKMIAEQTMHVFENLNSIPPGLLGSILLFIAYFVALGLAFVGVVGILALR